MAKLCHYDGKALPLSWQSFATIMAKLCHYVVIATFSMASFDIMILNFRRLCNDKMANVHGKLVAIIDVFCCVSAYVNLEVLHSWARPDGR